MNVLIWILIILFWWIWWYFVFHNMNIFHNTNSTDNKNIKQVDKKNIKQVDKKWYKKWLSKDNNKFMQNWMFDRSKFLLKINQIVLSGNMEVIYWMQKLLSNIKKNNVKFNWELMYNFSNTLKLYKENILLTQKLIKLQREYLNCVKKNSSDVKNVKENSSDVKNVKENSSDVKNVKKNSSDVKNVKENSSDVKNVKKNSLDTSWNNEKQVWF